MYYTHNCTVQPSLSHSVGARRLDVPCLQGSAAAASSPAGKPQLPGCCVRRGAFQLGDAPLCMLRAQLHQAAEGDRTVRQAVLLGDGAGGIGEGGRGSGVGRDLIVCVCGKQGWRGAEERGDRGLHLVKDWVLGPGGVGCCMVPCPLCVACKLCVLPGPGPAPAAVSLPRKPAALCPPAQARRRRCCALRQRGCWRLCSGS